MMEPPIYLPEVRCEVTLGGILPNGVTARMTGSDGRRQAVQVTRGMINRHDGMDYLPIGIVQIDRKQRRVLIELPTEADSGANRMWVNFDELRREATEETEVVA
jgi:hypothetical protein